MAEIRVERKQRNLLPILLGLLALLALVWWFLNRGQGDETATAVADTAAVATGTGAAATTNDTASGTLATGETFKGPEELKKHLLTPARKEAFVRNLTEKMLAYALGRGLESYDLPAVRKIAKSVEQDGCRSTTLIREIVKSYPFRYRKNL